MTCCVKNNALVCVLEYDGCVAADLFLVGRTIVARFATAGKEAHYPQNAVGAATHTLQIGEDGLWLPEIGVAAVPLDRVSGEIYLPGGRKVDVQELTQELGLGEILEQRARLAEREALNARQEATGLRAARDAVARDRDNLRAELEKACNDRGQARTDVARLEALVADLQPQARNAAYNAQRITREYEERRALGTRLVAACKAAQLDTSGTLEDLVARLERLVTTSVPIGRGSRALVATQAGMVTVEGAPSAVAQHLHFVNAHRANTGTPKPHPVTDSLEEAPEPRALTLEEDPQPPPSGWRLALESARSDVSGGEAAAVVDLLEQELTALEREAGGDRLAQILTDPENQPSQYGTVPAADAEAKRAAMLEQLRRGIDTIEGRAQVDDWTQGGILSAVRNLVGELSA